MQGTMPHAPLMRYEVLSTTFGTQLLINASDDDNDDNEDNDDHKCNILQ